METGRKASGYRSILKVRKRAIASAVGFLLPSTMRALTGCPISSKSVIFGLDPKIYFITTQEIAVS